MKLLLYAAILASITYLALTLAPLRIMWSGLTMGELLEAQPVYKLLGLFWFIGIVLFSISVIRSGFFPKWAGVLMLTGFVIFTASRPLGWPMVLVNINTIILSAVVIYLGVLGLKRAQGSA